MTAPFVILTGLSGSGKSAAMRAFEDSGYYCVDNLPVALIPVFADLCARSRDELPRVALVVDIRERRFLRDFPEVLTRIRRDHEVLLLFFEASDAVLARRFGETRRPHPMAGEAGDLTASIQLERNALEPIRVLADRVIDTTAFTVHDLKAHVMDNFLQADRASSMLVQLQSFGYKHGVPADVDLMLDVRFLPNPYFVDELRDLNGTDPAVTTFLDAQAEYRELLERLEGLMGFLLPLYVREGRSYLRIGIGCTGGKHRSVAVVEHLARVLAGHSARLKVSHRDMDRI